MIPCEGSLSQNNPYQRKDGGANPTSSLQFVCKEIPLMQAISGYAKWHYLGGTRCLATVSFGAFFGDNMVGCISYGAPNATEMKGYFTRLTQCGWWEIKRLAMANECPTNSESHFIGITTRLLRKKFVVKGIVTLADSKVGHVGTIYRASGFKYLGLSAEKKDYYINGKIQQRGKTKGMGGEWKPRSQKHVFIKVFANVDLGGYPT